MRLEWRTFGTPGCNRAGFPGSVDPETAAGGFWVGLNCAPLLGRGGRKFNITLVMLTPAGLSALWAAAGPRSSAERAEGASGGARPVAGPIMAHYRSMEAPVRFGEIGAPNRTGGVAGMVATVRSGGGAAAEEAEPRSRFPGLGPVGELLWGRGAAA